MNSVPKLHHIAKRIAPDSLETVIEMFDLLGCKVVYRPEGQRWAMISQDGLGINIQIGEVDELVSSKTRIGSHVAFISQNPKEDIERVEKWAVEKNLVFKKGGWSERELWFDLPDLFVDFVIEIMHVSILED